MNRAMRRRRDKLRRQGKWEESPLAFTADLAPLIEAVHQVSDSFVAAVQDMGQLIVQKIDVEEMAERLEAIADEDTR